MSMQGEALRVAEAQSVLLYVSFDEPEAMYGEDTKRITFPMIRNANLQILKKGNGIVFRVKIKTPIACTKKVRAGARRGS
jgi:hypothetical protein